MVNRSWTFLFSLLLAEATFAVEGVPPPRPSEEFIQPQWGSDPERVLPELDARQWCRHRQLQLGLVGRVDTGL